MCIRDINIGAGSSGDSTFLLAEAVKQGAKSWLQTVRDTEAITTCLEAGIGSNVSVEVGGKTDSLHGNPVMLNGRITRISDGRIEDKGTVHRAIWKDLVRADHPNIYVEKDNDDD